jgi:uncharacterized protein (UPF0548 family)
MNNPATFECNPVLHLDADPRQSGFTYSTLDEHFCAGKAQDGIEAGGTTALGGIVKKSKE